MEEDLRAEGSGTEEDEGGAQLRAEGAEGSDEWKSLSRVSNIPLVNSALRAYEQSKASSRVMKVRLPRRPVDLNLD